MIGIDIEEINRFNNWSDKEFLRIMSLKELEYAKSRKNPPEHLCGFYCVREALVKALNKNDIVFNKIETDHEKSGKPYLVENEYLKEIMKICGVKQIEISISHSKHYAVAVVFVNN